MWRSLQAQIPFIDLVAALYSSLNQKENLVGDFNYLAAFPRRNTETPLSPSFQRVDLVDLNQALPVKSISPSLSPASGFFSHVHASAPLFPQAHLFPDGALFSVAARSQVHSPAGRRRQEHRAPSVLFSVAAFSQLQFSCKKDEVR